MRLTDFARDEWSQFGEDGIIEHVFNVLGEGSRVCVEFGAGDGLECSNTKFLRDKGWGALLIEASGDRFERLADHESQLVHCRQSVVTPLNINDHLADFDVDFISIDVDGDDYAIFEAMAKQPRLVSIEYNASIPPHIDLRQRSLGEGFGSSALSLVNLAASRGYSLLGLNKGNLFFVRTADLGAFAGYECSLKELFDYSLLSYLVTDYGGRPVVTGATPPWGLVSQPFVGELDGNEAFVVTRAVAALCESFEANHGQAVFLGAERNYGVTNPGDQPVRLRAMLLSGPPLVIIDIAHHPVDACFDWISDLATACGYQTRIVPAGVIALFPRKSP